ncbi:MAG: 23S rRNA (guanosine(2251)-2'-O)-methyltransferase RlmB, partial [Acidobacteria bacterium]|nr:23S rRNA (guanosine(2251)-2'-O)-methyltransferase RlmB [Candidatus Sulfomarinibacter sp. MAG AM1]
MADELWTVGFHAVLGVLEGDQPVDALLLQQDRRDARMKKIRAAARRRAIRYDLVPRTRLDRVAGGVAHNGCALRTAPISFVPLEDLMAAA